MVPNPNYVAPAAALPSQQGSRLAASPKWTPPPPPSAQQPTISTMMMPPVIDTVECANVIKLMYDHTWPSYTKIPAETREQWFQKWVEKFIWDKMHNIMIRKIFDHWMARDLKKALYVHWETNQGFKHYHLTNRVNRASVRSSKYTSGSATFMKTKVRLTRDDNDNSTTDEVDPDTLWHKTTSEPYKNCVYGLGSFFTDNLRISTLRHLSASATSWPVDPKDNIDLREQVLELTQSLHQ
ncbi:uncharacterized protein DS421_13g407980 [Arachis hypogaea]|nr:uncharacterized protein DS421_13g407980 [Arachis hypogaea]